MIARFENGEFDVATLVLFALPIGDPADPDGAAHHPGRDQAAEEGARPAAPDFTSSSRTRAKSSTSLLPRNVAVQIYRALLENVASEMGAKMSAMDIGDPQCRRDDQEADDAL